MEKEKEKLYVVDGSGYLYRAYFGVRGLSAPDGFPTNAIYGMVTMLNAFLRNENPKNAVVAFDAKGGGETFRHKLWEGYKANRKAMPEDLAKQVPYIKDIVRKMGFKIIEKPAVEADDIIATIANDCVIKDIPLEIVTGDKDLLQLVVAGVSILDTQKKQRYVSNKDVEDFIGVPPWLIADLLALWGDTSDNIPGVPSIGEVTAAKLIRQFGSVNDIIAAAENGQVKGKTGEALVNFKDQALLSKQLASLDYHVPIEYKVEDFAVGQPDEEALFKLYRRFNFTSLIKGKQAPVQKPEQPEPALQQEAVGQSYQQQSMFEYEDYVS